MIAHVVAEVPVAPVIPAAALEALGLIVLLGTLLALGMGKVYGETLGALIRKLASIIDVPISIPHVTTLHPLRGVSHTLYSLDKQIRNGFAYIALKGEAASAWCFATAGNIFEWTGREIADLARDVLHALQTTTVATIPSAIRKAEAATLARLRGIDHSIGRIEAQARAQLKRLQVGIDRIGHGVTVTLPRSIAHVGARVGSLERTVPRLGKRVTALEKRLGAAAFTAAVALALTKIVGSWIRCPSLSRMGKKVGCKGFAWLEGLFADAFEALLVLDLCRFALAAQQLARIVVPQLGAVLLVQNAVCLGGGARLPSAADHPKTSTAIRLPSASD